MTINLNNPSLAVDFKNGNITSLTLNNKERLKALSPLFSLRLRDKEGSPSILTAYDAKTCTETADGAVYSDFPCADISVCVKLTDENGEAAHLRDPK